MKLRIIYLATVIKQKKRYKELRNIASRDDMRLLNYCSTILAKDLTVDRLEVKQISAVYWGRIPIDKLPRRLRSQKLW